MGGCRCKVDNPTVYIYALYILSNVIIDEFSGFFSRFDECLVTDAHAILLCDFMYVSMEVRYKIGELIFFRKLLV